MSISQKLSDISAARDTIRTKLKTIGIATDTDKLSALATKLSGMTVHSGTQDTVLEGTTYTIPAGYHDGTTSVLAESNEAGDDAKRLLQSKTVDPDPDQVKTVSPDAGYYGLSSVKVNAIPSKYKDISDTTADASTVLSGRLFVDKTGVKVAGTMANIGAVNEELSRSTTSYTIPAGYHNGNGTVSIELEEKTGDTAVTPDKSVHTITPSDGKVLSKVVVNAIPDNYADTSLATVDADELLSGTLAYGTANGKATAVTGTMPNNGTITASISGLDSTTNSYKIPKGYTSGGTITLTSDIEDLLASI